MVRDKGKVIVHSKGNSLSIRSFAFIPWAPVPTGWWKDSQMTHVLAEGFVLEKRNSDLRESGILLWMWLSLTFAPNGYIISISKPINKFSLVTEGDAIFQKSSLYECSWTGFAEQKAAGTLLVKHADMGKVYGEFSLPNFTFVAILSCLLENFSFCRLL